MQTSNIWEQFALFLCLFIYFSENYSAAPSSESEKDQLHCFHVWRIFMCLQPVYLPVASGGEEMSGLPVECMCESSVISLTGNRSQNF